ESDDVTKKNTTSTVARVVVMVANGSLSSMTNRAVGTLACTASAMPPSPNSSMCSAVLPNTANQMKPTRVGANSAPAMNSRKVRPREMRAMNMPTKGDQEIHQPQ